MIAHNETSAANGLPAIAHLVRAQAHDASWSRRIADALKIEHGQLTEIEINAHDDDIRGVAPGRAELEFDAAAFSGTDVFCISGVACIDLTCGRPAVAIKGFAPPP